MIEEKTDEIKLLTAKSYKIVKKYVDCPYCEWVHEEITDSDEGYCLEGRQCDCCIERFIIEDSDEIYD
jgi:hypothetical protein